MTYVIFHALLWSVDFFFQNELFSTTSFTNTIRVSNRLGSDQDRLSVGPDQCLPYNVRVPIIDLSIPHAPKNDHIIFNFDNEP